MRQFAGLFANCHRIKEDDSDIQGNSRTQFRRQLELDEARNFNVGVLRRRERIPIRGASDLTEKTLRLHDERLLSRQRTGDPTPQRARAPRIRPIHEGIRGTIQDQGNDHEADRRNDRDGQRRGPGSEQPDEIIKLRVKSPTNDPAEIPRRQIHPGMDDMGVGGLHGEQEEDGQTESVDLEMVSISSEERRSTLHHLNVWDEIRFT